LAQIRPGDTLVVWRLDRLGGSTTHLLQTVTELGERGIGFQSLTEAIDTTTSAGRLLFGILASLAAFERDLIRERTMAGLSAARARGNLGGRPSAMTPEKLDVARRMLAEGRSKSSIAKTIESPGPRSTNTLAGLFSTKRLATETTTWSETRARACTTAARGRRSLS
jgi:DNA invertase Pin-like site-specific DNA recombinase